METQKRIHFLRPAARLLFCLGLAAVLLIGGTGIGLAQQNMPELPSSFYGYIHILDTPPAVGTHVDVTVTGVDGVLVWTTVTLQGADLVYAIDVPADDLHTGAKDGGETGDTVTFSIGTRVVATGTFTRGTNQRVDFHPPQASATNNGPINEGGTATIDASSSQDWKAGDLNTYAFDCDNNGVYETGPQSGATADCAFADNGAFTVGVKVVDKQGGEGTTTTTMTVNNVAPTADLSNNGPVYEGTPATITFSNQYDPSSVDTAAGFHYAFQCEGLSLETATYANSGTSPSTTCTFSEQRFNTVVARIIDKNDGYSEYTTVVHLWNVAPVVTAPTNQTVDEGSSAAIPLGSFSDFNAYHPWVVDVDWGDGSPHTTFTELTAGTLPATNHTYAAGPNTYTVRVRVTDDNGGGLSDYKDFTVTVNNVAPAITAGSDETILQGATFTRGGSFTDPGADSWTATVNYGDGSGDQALSLDGKDFSLSHNYLLAGPHTVAVTVDDGTTTSTATFVVTVQNVAPTATFSAPPVNEGSILVLTLSGLFDPGQAVETYTYAFDCGGGTYDNFSGSDTASCPTTDNGDLTVRGIVRDSNGGQTEYTLVVTIADVLPTGVSGGVEYTTETGQAVILNGAATCVPVDECVYEWNLDGDGDFGDTGEVGLSVSYTWYPVGDYTVQFQVRDNDGNTVVADPAAVVHVTAATHAITLVPGWNLVSFNLAPINTDPAAVLSSLGVNYDIVYAWDASQLPGHNWLRHDTNPETTDTLMALNARMGFWVHITSGTHTLNVSGSKLPSNSISLYITGGGWNLVGFPHGAGGWSLPAALTDHGISIDSLGLIYAYHAADTNDPWKLFDKQYPDWPSDLHLLDPGWGYWIFVSTDSTWHVEY